MYRPPYGQHNIPGHGRGIAGGFHHQVVYPSQHPNFTFHGNLQYPMNVPNLPQQNPFQNPGFNQPPNPYLRRPPAPLPQPAPLNRGAVLERLESRAPTAMPQPPPLNRDAMMERFESRAPAAMRQPAPLNRGKVLERPERRAPAAMPQPVPLNKGAVLERLKTTVLKIQKEMVTAGKSVSAQKVSQAALVALKADSWDSLGFQLQDVPPLRRLIFVEGKVNAFIHCSVAVRKIISLYDLEVALCKSEGVERFEELGLGPLLQHPLVEHYFSIPKDSREVFKITIEEIIGHLKLFAGCKSRKLTTADGFLDFLAQKKSVSSKERLGVRIQNLGLHISCIRKANTEEKIVMGKFVKSFKPHVQKHRKNFTPRRKHRKDTLPEPPVHNLQKKALDWRRGSICKRAKSFSSKWHSGKHIRFSSSEGNSDKADDVSVDNDKNEDGCTENATDLHKNQSSSYSKNSGKHVSSCPYPSTSEEIARLGLKLEKNGNSSAKTRKSLNFKDKRFSGNKRKFEEKKNHFGYLSRTHKKRKKHHLDDQEKPYLCFNSDMMKKFITTWKEACLEHSVPEIVNMMISSYSTSAEEKKMLKRLLLSYPCLGALNVAVASIRRGMLDSPYDAFQTLNGSGFSNQTSDEFTEIIEIEPIAEQNNISIIGGDGDKPQIRITANDIIRKIIDYVSTRTIIPRESEFSGKFQSLKKFCDCEAWLIGQFSAKEFSSFGHGNFIDFLEKCSSLLPYEVYNFICEKPGGDTPEVVVSMPQEQLRVFLSQAHDNVIENDAVTKNTISVLLKKQFPTISFDVIGERLDKRLSTIVENHRTSGSLSCVLFSVTLLGKQCSDISSEFKEKYLPEVDEFMEQETSPFGTLSFGSALECLLNAPMLSDLVSWSHWDIVYASSLGPLLEWLLYEVDSKVLLCIATRDGKLVKVDPLATVDDFLDTFIQCSSFKIAVKMLSLVALYRGTNNAPITLLKCYTKQAIDVVIRNSIGSLELKGMDENCICRSSSQTEITLHGGSSPPSCDFQGSFGNSQCTHLDKSLPRVKKAASIIARLILECLSHLPSEFWNFAADILVSGLQSFIKEAPLIILQECKQLDQRLMLHELGLSLGVPEWIQDYQQFTSIATITTNTCSEFSMNENDAAEASLEPHHDNPRSTNDTIVDSISNEAHETSNERKENKYDGLTDGCLKAFDSYKSVLTEVPDDYEMTECSKVREASHIIEAIRHEEFGLDKKLTGSESCLLQKQHARLGRALHCLSQELYSQDSHLLLELIQNADDNTYSELVDPALVFILQANGIAVLNNEKGFSAQNIRALCDIGSSTKKGSNAGYIGHKGLGFKSVFRVTDAPQIHSNGFHIKFDISEGQIGFVLPTLIPACDKHMFGQLLAGDDFGANCTSWNTCILLPFRSNFLEGTKISSIASMFSDLHPSLLLFLHRLRCIKFKNMLDGTSLVMKREVMNDGIVKVTHGKETMSWMVINKKLQAAMFHHSGQTTEIALAFPVQETDSGEYRPYLTQQPVFSFLPLRQYGLKFILQGDFILPSSREEVDGDSGWNQWLLSEFPALFVSAEQSFCSFPFFQKSPGKAITAYMSFVPLVGEVHGFFSPLPHMIITRLRLSNCLLLDSPNTEWVLPCRALRGWTEHTRMVLSDSLLKEHLGLVYLSRDIFLSDTLARALGVQEYGPRILIDFISSLCRVTEGIKSLGPAWLSSWLVALHSTLLSQSFVHSSLIAQLEVDVTNSLRKVPFLPLLDGSYSSISDGPIWLPCDNGKNDLKDFPILYAKLRIVDPLLFTETPSNKIDDVLQMLYKIGVRKLSAHEVIQNHVLAALSDDKQTNNDESWKIEYLSFIMVHFQFPCANCHTEKQEMMSQLREKHVILTNDGFKCAASEPIHFSKEYGNPVDINKLIDSELKWFELDAVYLKHPSTKTISSGPEKCREFFMELGVTDFVQVFRVDKNASDFLQSNDMKCSGVLIDRTSLINDWESPELVTMLSTFSLKKCRDKCIYFLKVLDNLWDEYYSEKARIYVTFETIEYTKSIESSFVKSIREIQWIASSLDQELHYPSDLFYDCQELRSFLGAMGPYVVPKVTSKLLLKDIRFRTELSYDNALKLLHDWSMSKSPLVSPAQMSRFYTYISDGVVTSKVKLNEELIESSFIFVPFLNISEQDDANSGTFYSPKHLYWHDPTGCVGKTNEMLLKCMFDGNSLPCEELSNAYPCLHDFFVNVCGVPEVPPFDRYLQILLHLSSVALPSQAAHAVFKVLLRWSDDLTSGLVKSGEVLKLKESLQRLENRVLPTLHDKWVSLHPTFGLICWVDDDELKQHFKHSDAVDFLQFGELSSEEKNMLAEKIRSLMQQIGIPALSEVVSREAISYGSGDTREKEFLINWILPYAQRYIYTLHAEIYLKLKQDEHKSLTQLKLVVVENLYYRYMLKGSDSTSKKQFQCNCLLQENMLFVVQTCDSHSIFLELSRLFFDGSSDLHFANFLHMIATMLEAGSTIEQIEFFIVQSQKILHVPDEEFVWSLSNTRELLELENHQQDNAVPIDVEQPASISIEVIQDWDVEENLTLMHTSKLQDSLIRDEFCPSSSYNSSHPGIKPMELTQKRKSTELSKITELVRCPDPKLSLNLSAYSEKDKLSLQKPDDQQLLITGRLGEIVAYKYFIEKLGPNKVRWVNKDVETGLPYDLIIGDDGSREYIEVKSTRLANKPWFHISTREWQFAMEMGDSFSIARIVLSRQKQASIALLKNPIKLCQQNNLSLAVLMSREVKGSLIAN